MSLQSHWCNFIDFDSRILAKFGIFVLKGMIFFSHDLLSCIQSLALMAISSH